MTVTFETVLEQVRADHGMTQAHHLTQARKRLRPMGGFVMFDRGYMAGWWNAVRWLLHAQGEWESLTVGEALAELRKGQASIYPVARGDDPHFWADCPGCDKPVLIDREGLCDTCGHDFEGEQA